MGGTGRLVGDNMGNGDVRVNVIGTKVVMGGEQQMVVQKAVGWPCIVSGGVVGDGSIRCVGCQRWVHRGCGGVGCVSRVMESFVCGGCFGPVTIAGCTGMDVGVSASLELVDGFCCLGDMLGVGGGADAAVDARVWVRWSVGAIAC